MGRKAKRGTFWLSLLIGVLTVLVVAAAFNVPLERRASSTAVISAHTVDAINAAICPSGQVREPRAAWFREVLSTVA